ncbi:hypothetical protein L1887_19040 [Cichorium endivia]|nr:hypothetical protein L1887_19040 [Cichorium endivia]
MTLTHRCSCAEFLLELAIQKRLVYRLPSCSCLDPRTDSFKPNPTTPTSAKPSKASRISTGKSGRPVNRIR